MQQIIKRGLQKAVQEAQERCSTKAYEIHGQLVQEKSIRNPSHVKEILDITGRILDGEWEDVIDEWGTLSGRQKAVIEAVMESANSTWELAGIMTHVCSYLMVGYATLHTVTGGRRGTNGMWMGRPMS